MSAVLLWPQALGGSMTYLVPSGASMGATVGAGDLAVVRAAGDYDVGDVVAYRSETLDRVVLHRIISESGGTFRLQGDANDFVDPDVVRPSQVLGRMLVRLPGVSKAVAWLLEPLHLALAGLGVVLLMSDRSTRTAAEPAARHAAPRRPAPPLRVAVSNVQVPEGTVVAEVVSAVDLQELARRYDRPVLVDEEAGLELVLEGSVLFRCRVSASRAKLEASRGSGRDWQYDRQLVDLPRPRRLPAPDAPPRRRLTAVG